MALGELRVELDPAGYYRSTEVGWEHEWLGSELAASTAAPSATGLQRLPFLKPEDDFWNPPNSQWLLCRPRQFDSTWYKSASLDDHVVYKNNWTPCTGLSSIDILETEPTNLGAGNYPSNLWMSFTAPLVLGAQPISVNFTNLATAAGMTLETGTGVVLATNLPVANKTPFLQFVQYPDPSDQVIFGFGDLCFIFNQGGIRLMRSPSNDLQTWELLRRWSPSDPIGGRSTFTDVMSLSSGTGEAPSEMIMTTRIRSALVALVGSDCLFIGGEAHGETVQMRHTNRNGSGLAMRPGKWWLAAFPRQKVYTQVQVVRYSAAEHALLDTPADASAVFFDLGENYTPIEAPVVTADILVHGDGSDPLDIVTTEVTGGQIVTGNTSGEIAEARLIDENNGAWVSGLGRHKGALRLALTPGNDEFPQGFGDTACTSPMLRRVTVRFPPHQTARQRTTGANIGDTLWTSIIAETSIRDPLSKRVTITLPPAGSELLSDLGFLHRSDFPLHLTEDTAGDNTFATIRLRAWVESIEQEEVGLEDADPAFPQVITTIIARGLLYRLEKSPWLYLTELVSTADNGELPHTVVPDRVLAQSGWDTSDTDLVYIEEDTAEGLVPILPGSDDDQGDGVGKKASSPYAPELDEEKATYVARIASEWRGWRFWETLDGQIRYESDLLTLISEEGEDPPANATLYQSTANAVAAGKTGQAWLAESQERYEPPITNQVIVSGVDGEGHVLRHVIDTDTASITGTIADTPNFLGEPTRAVRYETRLGITESALSQIARIALWRLRRSRRVRKWGVMLPPWRIGDSGLRPGYILTAEGRGDWFINAVRAELLGKGRTASAYEWRTIFDCETLPPSEVA